MNIREISIMLSEQAENVCRVILPNGKREGSEWCVGSVNGETGKSLKVKLTGSKSGLWSDFATGQAGDLIDLWREVHGLTTHGAICEVKNYLGIREPELEQQKQFTAPKVPAVARPKSAVLEFLHNRKLSKSIKAYQVAESGDYVVFPFKFSDVLRMCKQRNVFNKKDQRPTSAGQEPCLFGWQAIPEDQRDIFICEGELDAMAMYEYGYPALSVPFGGGSGNKQSWIENEYHNLDRFEEIYLCLDTDREGQEATKEIIKRLGQDRCKVVTLPGKDANECLTEGVDKRGIDSAIRNARSLDPEELKASTSYHDKVVNLLHPDDNGEPGFFSPWPKLRDKLFFRFSELTISNGVNGHGKSQIVGHFALSAMAQGERVCIASMELKPERLLARLTRQAAGLSEGIPTEPYIKKIFKWYEDRLWIYECTTTAKAERILETFRYARKRYGVRVFVIDSLMMCGIGEDDYNAQKAFVQAICDFKNETDSHVFLVTHSRKGASEEIPGGKFDVKGTGTITDLADNVLTIWRNKKKENDLEDKEKDVEEVEKMPDALLICSKQRNGDWEGKTALWFCKNSYQYLPKQDWRLFQYVNYSENETLAP